MNLIFVFIFLLMINDTLSVGDTDLTSDVAKVLDKMGRDIYVIFSDMTLANSSSSIQLSKLLKEVTHSSVDLLTLSQCSFAFPPALETTKCNELLEEDRLDIFGGRKTTRGKLFLIMLQSKTDLETFFDVVEKTAIQPGECEVDIRTGAFNRENTFIFDFTLIHADYSYQEEHIFNKSLIIKHRYVGLLKTAENGEMIMIRHNMYTAQNQMSKWPKSAISIQDLFPPFSMSGYEFTIAGMPHDVFITAERKLDSSDEIRLFTNYSGLEAEMLHIVSKILDYKYNFVNPADQQWGIIVNEKFNGMVKMVMDNKADFAIGAIGRQLKRRKANVWLFAVLSGVLVTICIWQISKKEESIIKIRLSNWSYLGQAAWYVFGTFIGESITRVTNCQSAWSLRSLISVWLLFSFILTAGYGGQLRSFLLNPEYEDPIDTLEKVLDRGISWEMGLYGEEIEITMANSEHPTMKAIWDGKIPVTNEPFAFQRMQQIADGERILIDWKIKLDTSMFIGFTLSNGEQLMEYYKMPIVQSDVECVWGFNPFNPHVER